MAVHLSPYISRGTVGRCLSGPTVKGLDGLVFCFVFCFLLACVCVCVCVLNDCAWVSA